jgi:SAM-dependent methyltransferase
VIREVNCEYYSKRFRDYGEDVKSLWGSKESQEIRFAIFCRIGELDGASILDVGCGFGDFYGYLERCNIRPKDYLGLDCVEETLAVARRRHPGAKFESWDLFDLEDAAGFDWVFGSGLFTLTGPDWNDYVSRTVKRMFSLARRGVGVNFLSSLTGRVDGLSHYSHHAETLRLLEDAVYPIVELVHSYRPNDFTVFLYHAYGLQGNR